MAEDQDLAGAIRAAEAIAVDAQRGQTRGTIVETFGQAAEEFEQQFPYAADSKKYAHLAELARQQADARKGCLTGAEQVVDVTLAAVVSAIDTAKPLPDEAARLELDSRPHGVSFTNVLLARLLDAQKESTVLAALAGADVVQVEKQFDAAVQRGDLAAQRTLEREILAGLPSVSTRKGDPAKNAVSFDKLRRRVEAAQLERVPQDLRDAKTRLEQHRARLRTWRLAVGPYADRAANVEALTADWQALRKAREQG
jgi:hypothetical protein